MTHNNWPGEIAAETSTGGGSASNDTTAIAAPAAQDPLPWQWRDVGKAILFIVLISFLVSGTILGAMIATGNGPAEGDGMAAIPLFLIGVAIYAVVLLAVYLFAARRTTVDGRDGWRLLGWRSFSIGWVWALPGLVLVQFIGMAVANLLFVVPFVSGEYENPQIEAITGGGMLSQRDLALLMILIAIVAPLAEELFFRGMLYPLMRQRWSATLSIVANGLLFSLIHVMPPLLPGLFVVGMVLAWVRERSGSVIPCIFLHALQNGLVLWGIYQVVNGALG
ncbi:MAG: type II CAAX endopeptidase family protein [Caldilineaceae bacterium]